MDLVFAVLGGLAIGLVVGYAVATTRQAALIGRARAAEDKLAYAEGRMAEHFEALSAKALDASNQRFLELADARLKAAGVEAAGELERRKQAVEHLVAPLAGDRNIVVDSKVSLAAYLEAAETDDAATVRNRMDAHARHLREHID